MFTYWVRTLVVSWPITAGTVWVEDGACITRGSVKVPGAVALIVRGAVFWIWIDTGIFSFARELTNTLAVVIRWPVAATAVWVED